MEDGPGGVRMRNRSSNPRRTRVLHLIILGLALLAAWTVVLLNASAGYGAPIAVTGILVTVLMMGVLGRSYITRRGLGGIVAALSIASLLLALVAMVLLLLQWM